MIRRAIGTTLVGLCALAGPMASSALADTADPAPALTLSAASVRQGIPFTVNGAAGCPSEDGVQTVQFSYTDSAGLIFPSGSIQTGDDGSWSDAAVQLPVAAVDDSGDWVPNGVAAGPGTLDATCLTSDDSDDPDPGDPGDDAGDGSSTDPGDPGDGSTADPGDGSTTDPGDGDGDPGDGDPGDSDGSTTLTYASAALTVTGSAPQLSVSTSGSTATVTPAEACAGTGAADVDLALLGIGDNASDDALATATTSTSADGTWTPVALALPDGGTGDFAVTATCSQDGVVTSSYDAQPLALGTVLLSKPACTARGATAQISGTYTGTITSAGKDVTAGLIKLSGAGPWKVRLQSAGTGRLLLAQTETCAQPMFDFTVPKTGTAGNGQVQAKVCNTGRAAAVAVLQILKGKRGTSVDTETLAPGECGWLQGGSRLHRGDDARAQVLLDPPGHGSSDTDVEQSFSVHRPRH